MARNGNIYIVDNSEELSTGFHYLSEWCDLATSFDIATGFFEMALSWNWTGSGRNSTRSGS